MRIIKKLISCLSAYLEGPVNSNKGNKIIYFNLKEPEYFSRYLYNLVKFFHIEGYKIHFPNKHIQFRKLCSTYSHLLIKEKIIHFTPPSKDIAIELNDHNLRPEYFSFLNNSDSTHENTFYIPMAMYPGLYYRGLWNKPVSNKKKKKSIFMIGAFNEVIYKKVEDAFPDIINRDVIYNFLENENILTPFRSRIELNKFIEGITDNKCIIIKRNNFNIPLGELRPVLGNFNFFMALPGTSMPYSHNLIEAMSVGSIPLIQKPYSEMMHPPLRHGVNAIVFSSLEDLSTKIRMAYNLPEEKMSIMTNHVKDYYRENLTPDSVVKKVIHYADKKIYLLNLKSIQLYKERSFRS